MLVNMTNRLKNTAITLLLLLVYNLSLAGGLRLYFENDFPFDDDSDYTNGARLEYFWDDWSVFAEQLMYSPETIRSPVYIDGTHPYAGYLGIGVSRVYDHRISDRFTWLNRGEFQVGILGPSSLAEDTQTFVHKVVGAHRPEGWEYQLHDEFEIQFVYFTGIGTTLLGDRRSWHVDWDNEIGGYIGTMQISAGINSDIKLGYGSRPRRGEIEIRDLHDDVFGYILAGFEGRWWGWNVFLDGNRDGDSVSVDKEIFTAAFKTGLGIDVYGCDILLIYLFKTREYKTQRHTPNYMSFSIGYNF